MSTHALLLLQHNIALKEARDYGNTPVHVLNGYAENISGIGYPMSADALRLVRDCTDEPCN